MPLTELNISYNTQASDLSHLQGMELAVFNCTGTQVSDLSPLRGMKLNGLFCVGTPTSDLSPLRGMPLTILVCEYTQVANLTPLKGMPLKTLKCGYSQVSDLSPLVGMSLIEADFSSTRVSDLSVLKGMPLKTMGIFSNTLPIKGPVLEYLKDAPLTTLALPPLESSELYVALRTFKQLTFVRCSGVIVSDAVIDHILSLDKLERLELMDTSVSDVGLLRLMNLPNLSSVKLYNSASYCPMRYTKVGVAALQKALPNCKIEWDDPAKATPPQPTASGTK